MKLDYFGYRKAPDKAKETPAALVVGKADFLRSLVVDDLLKRSLGDGDRGMNLLSRDASAGAAVDVTAILDDLRTPSLLGGPRVVHLRGLEGLDKEDRKRLEEYVSQPASGARLVLEATTLPANTRLFKAVERGGMVVQCRNLYDRPPPWARGGGKLESELARWIRLRTEDRGKKIEPAAILVALEAWGTDLAPLDGALEQACVLVGKASRIRDVEMRALAPASRADPVYRVVDQVLSGDSGGAARGLRSVLIQGIPDSSGRGRDSPGGIAQILIRGIQGKLTSIWRAHLLKREGKGEEEILQALGVRPFLAKDFWKQVEANPEAGIPEALQVLLETERSIKTGRAEPAAAAEGLIARLG